jgi:putative ABC transport system permease protein
MQTMLSAFQLNLSAMSMVSLLVGTFLVYNTVYTSVTRRRTELGILRSLGMTRTEVRWLFLGEACALGMIGAVIGSFGGIGLGRVLTGAVEQTVSSLYVLVSIERLALNPLQFLTAVSVRNGRSTCRGVDSCATCGADRSGGGAQPRNVR